MPHQKLDGWKLFHAEEGTGPPIILIHGLLMDNTMFDHQTRVLKDRYRVIRPDLRGHGESEHRAEEHTQWDLMEDQIALLDSKGIDRAIWGGVSQGGFQSLRAALRYPDRVLGLILIDTQAGPEDESTSPLYEAMASVLASDGWNEQLVEAAKLSMFGESASTEVKDHWGRRWMSQETVDALEVMKAVSRRDDITDQLSKIDAPAIVLHGEEDVAIEMERAEELANGLKGLVEFVKVPNAGHSSTVEQPEAVTAALERFLDKVRS